MWFSSTNAPFLPFCILKFTCYECDSLLHQKSASITFVTKNVTYVLHFHYTFVTPVTYAIPGVTNVVQHSFNQTSYSVVENRNIDSFALCHVYHPALYRFQTVHWSVISRKGFRLVNQWLHVVTLDRQNNGLRTTLPRVFDRQTSRKNGEFYNWISGKSSFLYYIFHHRNYLPRWLVLRNSHTICPFPKTVYVTGKQTVATLYVDKVWRVMFKCRRKL